MTTSIRKIKNYLLHTLFLPFWYTQKYLFKRKENVWIFGAWFGKKYADNPKALFQYVNKNAKDIKCIWISKDKNIINSLRNEGYEAYYYLELNGIYKTLTAKYAIVGSGKEDINSLFTNGIKWVQLWHGNPFKKIGLDDKYKNYDNFFQKRIVKNIFPFLYSFSYDIVTSNSQWFVEAFSTAFRIKNENILVTGNPRNDYLFSTTTESIIEQLNTRYKDPTYILYMPTFREGKEKKDLFRDYEFDEEAFENFLTKNNCVFLYKGHFVDNLPSISFNRFYQLKDTEVSEVNVLLKDTDILITDYSSVFFDFLLTQRPIIFAGFDLKEYLSGSRQMYYQFHETVPGPIANNWPQVLNELDKFLTGSDSFEDARKEKNLLFNTFQDQKNSQRAYLSLIKK